MDEAFQTFVVVDKSSVCEVTLELRTIHLYSWRSLIYVTPRVVAICSRLWEVVTLNYPSDKAVKDFLKTLTEKQNTVPFCHQFL